MEYHFLAWHLDILTYILLSIQISYYLSPTRSDHKHGTAFGGAQIVTLESSSSKEWHLLVDMCRGQF